MKAKAPMPAQVRRVEEQFRRWRGGKDQKDPIPGRLWQAAARLCDDHSVHRVSRWLGLNHTSLQKRAPERRRAARRASPRFVEWRLPAGIVAGAPAAEYVVELDGGSARRVSVRGASAAEVAALVQGLKAAESASGQAG